MVKNTNNHLKKPQLFVSLIFGKQRTRTGIEKSFHVHLSEVVGMDSGGPLFP